MPDDDRLVLEVPEAGRLLGLSPQRQLRGRKTRRHSNHQDRQADQGAQAGVPRDARAGRGEMNSGSAPAPSKPFVPPQVFERDDGLFAIGWHDDAAGPFQSRRHAESVAASAGAKMAVSP